MNKTELVTAVQGKLDVSGSQADKIVNTVLDTISEGLVKDGTVNITRFGRFSVRAGKNGKIKTPQGKVISYKGQKKVSFRTGSTLKATVNGKKSAKKAAKPAAKKGKK